MFCRVPPDYESRKGGQFTGVSTPIGCTSLDSTNARGNSRGAIEQIDDDIFLHSCPSHFQICFYMDS